MGQDSREIFPKADNGLISIPCDLNGINNKSLRKYMFEVCAQYHKKMNFIKCFFMVVNVEMIS